MKKIAENVFIIEKIDPTKECIPYIIDTQSKYGLIIIDPGLYTEYFQELNESGFSVKQIQNCLITHEHLDHYGGCFELEKINKNVKYYAHELGVKKIEEKLDPAFISNNYSGYDYKTVKITKKLNNLDILKFGEYQFTCIHTPGHSPGAVAYLLELDSNKILFAGDIGGSALKVYGGNIEDYLNSMQKLLNLNINILCEGHTGIIKSTNNINAFIHGFMKFNKNFHHIIEENQTDVESWYNASLNLYELKEYDYAFDFCSYLLELAPDNSKVEDLYNKIKQHNPPKIDYIKKFLERMSILSKK